MTCDGPLVSSLATKRHTIDKDCCDSVGNEGHIRLPLDNRGEALVTIQTGDGVAEGSFTPYVTVDDDSTDGVRTVWIGSTGQ